MFKVPQEYTKYNSIQQNDTRDILSQFKEYFSWKDCEYVLDIGSGCGKITSQLLLPFLPASVERLIGSDISKEMVLHAEKINKIPNLAYVVFDAEETDQSILKNTFSDLGIKHGFDKVFSFFCFHWIKNQRQAIQNMYSLTRPGGQCLVIFIGYTLLIDVWKAMCSLKRWQPYLKNADKLEETCPIVFSKNIIKKYSSMLRGCGFKVTTCYCMPRETTLFDNSSVFHFRLSVKTIDPLIQHIPTDLQESYMDDLINVLTTKSLKQCGRKTHPYKLLVAFFSKPVKRNAEKRM